jgi:two-component system alkaline phosphatase synthesis response regulator PhoP
MMQPAAHPKSSGTVIIADDDPLIRSVLRSKLQGIGQSVVIAKDGLEAVEAASTVRATLIVLDFNMPRLNGLEACERIRALPLNADTPIVALTALNMEDVVQAATRAGATMFLTKPIGMPQLLGAISRYLPLDDAARRAIAASGARAKQIADMAPRLDELEQQRLRLASTQR